MIKASVQAFVQELGATDVIKRTTYFVFTFDEQVRTLSVQIVRDTDAEVDGKYITLRETVIETTLMEDADGCRFLETMGEYQHEGKLIDIREVDND